MKIAIHGKKFSAETKPIIQELFDELLHKGAQLIVSDKFHGILKAASIETGGHQKYVNGEELEGVDMLFTLGGDGTLLEAVTHVREKSIPILGINTGRLGFLATTAKEDIRSAVNAVFSGRYQFDTRTLVRLDSDQSLFGSLNFALNDFAILKKDSASMIVVHVYVDGEFLNSYWADGVIVSTPTGSTGYNLSCGGPLVLPNSNNFIITPVSPHSLTLRPIVMPDSCKISFEIEGREKNFLVSLDSRFETVGANVKLSIEKEVFQAVLVKLEGNNIFETMRQKLNWGQDARN